MHFHISKYLFNNIFSLYIYIYICKVMIFNYIYVGFNSVSNLIVFHQSFPYMFVGFNVMG